MPVTFELQEDGCMMVWRIADPWKIEELKAYYPQAKHYLASTTQMIHTLVDVRDAHRVPPDVLSARHTSTWNDPMSGQMAVVGAAGIIRMTMETVFRLVQFTRVQFFDSETEARAYLRKLIAQDRARSQMTL